MAKGQNPNLDPIIEGPAQTGSVPKNFRSHPDIENFFRFIYENDLREEALEIMDRELTKKMEKRLSKKASN